MNKIIISFLVLTAMLAAAAVLHGKEQPAASPRLTKLLRKTNRLGLHGHARQLLRGLQPEPPPLPEPPDGEPASYCDFLFLFFDAYANAYGYDCECEADDEKDTVTCDARNLACDAYDVGDVQVICHHDHVTASLTRGSVHEEGYKVFDMTACAEYSDPQFAPEPLAGSEFCYVYQLSAVLGKGYNLDECGMTWAKDGGEPEQVCTCSICYTTVGIFTYWGLGLDCQDSLIPGITLAQCQPLTDMNPAVIPLIEEYRSENTSTTAQPITDPPSSTIAATESTTTISPTTTDSTTTTGASPSTSTTISVAASTTTTLPSSETTTTMTAPTTSEITTTVNPTATDPSTTTGSDKSETTDETPSTDLPTLTSCGANMWRVKKQAATAAISVILFFDICFA